MEQITEVQEKAEAILTELGISISSAAYEIFYKQIVANKGLSFDVKIQKAAQSDNDPLLQLAGIFESAITDISEHHDKYIGEALNNGDI